MTYLSAFATSSCIVTHTLLYHGQTLLNGLKRNVEADDIHAKLMRNYPEVPGLWYLTLFFYLFRVGRCCHRGVGHRDTGLELAFVYCVVSYLSLAEWFCLCDDGAGGGSFCLLEN